MPIQKERNVEVFQSGLWKLRAFDEELGKKEMYPHGSIINWEDKS